jgi:hypothetical protein
VKVMMAEVSAPTGVPVRKGITRKNQRITITSGDRAHGVDIGAGRQRQGLDRRQTRQRQQGADDNAARHGDQRQAQGE